MVENAVRIMPGEAIEITTDGALVTRFYAFPDGRLRRCLKPDAAPLDRAANAFRLGDRVTHPDIYHGNEVFTVVGIRERELELELEGDWSGGTHGTVQRAWHPLEGTVRAEPKSSEA